MRRPESLAGYTVEVSSAAWKQLAQLPLETYQRIRGELDTLAAWLGTHPPAPLPPKGTSHPIIRSFALEDHVAHYDVDPERRLLTLREVSRRSPRDG
jgi:hypothetical protein